MALTAIYVRVSTEEQATRGSGLEAQEAECRARAASQGWGPVRLYVDAGVSGSRASRPALDRLLADARAGELDRVLCADPDRLARDLTHLLSLMDALRRAAIEVRFVSLEVSFSPDGRLLLALRGAIAEFETHRIRDRMLSGKRARAREGRPTGGGQTIYGYRYRADRKRFEADPAEAAVVREAFSLAGELGTGAIAARLDALGVPPRRGGRWSQASVYGMLRNPTYLGRMPQMGGLGHVSLPRLVEPGAWRLAQRALDGRRNRPPGRAVHPYLLTGRVACGLCGGPAIGGFGRSGGRGTKYACAGRRSGAQPPCDSRAYPSREVDGAVWRGLAGVMARLASLYGRPGAPAPPDGAVAERARARRHLSDLERGEVRLARLVRRGLLTEGAYAAQRRDLEAERALVARQAAELDRREERRLALSATAGTSPPAVAAAQAMVEDGLALEDMRRLCAALAVEVVLGPGDAVTVRLGAVSPTEPAAP